MGLQDLRRSAALFVMFVAGAAFASAQSPTLAVVEEPIPGGAHYPLAADLDGDGDIDLLGESAALTCLNDGEGRFIAGWTGAPPQVYFSTQSPVTFDAAPWRGATVADLNGDGVLDWVGALGVGAVWRPGVPTGGFSFATGTGGSFPASFGAFGVATGDIDGDGDVDVLVCSSSAPGLKLFRNAGGGVFTDATVGSGLASTAITAAVLKDLDGDGDLDLVAHAMTPVPFGAFVQANTGGVFGPAIGLPGAPQTSVRLPAVGDFDGDGLVDIVRFGSLTWPVEVLRQSPALVFAPLATVPLAAGAPFNVRDARAADLDGDGADDLIVVGDRGTATFRLIGGALVEYQAELPYGGGGALVFDADQDGDPDFMVTKGATATVPSYGYFLNSGSGGVTLLPGGLTSIGVPSTLSSFTPVESPTSAVVRDETSGKPVVVTLSAGGTGCRLHRALSDGHGRFAMQIEFPIAGAPTGFFAMTASLEYGVPRLAAGDFDGDGDDDLIAGNVKMPGFGDHICVAWLRNDGVAGYSATTLDADAFPGIFYTRELLSADFNGDGAEDCVVLALDVSVYLSNPGSGPVLSSARPATTAVDAAVGDFDDDGDLDLALRTTVASVAVWVNQGNGSFTLGPLFAAAVDGPVDAGDFDGDGKCDVVHGDALFLRTGPMQFATQSIALPPSTDARRVVFDVDADGDLDLLSKTGLVLRNDGAAGFAPLSWLPAGNGPGVPFDVDGDGDVDLVRSEGPRLYTNLGRQLAARGPVRPGYEVSFDVYGPPSGAFLVAASAVELVPAVATPFGALSLDPFTGVVLVTGSLDASGRVAFSSLVDPVYGGSLVGTTFVVQAVVDGGSAGARLTNARPTLVLPP